MQILLYLLLQEYLQHTGFFGKESAHVDLPDTKTAPLNLSSLCFIHALCKITSFQLISWHGDLAERHSFCRISVDLPENLQKLYLSAKCPHQKTRSNYGILGSVYSFTEMISQFSSTIQAYLLNADFLNILFLKFCFCFKYFALNDFAICRSYYHQVSILAMTINKMFLDCICKDNGINSIVSQYLSSALTNFFA